MNELILVDFSWLYNRYYYVTSYNAEISNKTNEIKDRLQKALMEFLNVVHRAYPKSKVLLLLDPSTATLKNKLIFEGYKQNRDKEAKKEVYSYLRDVVKFLCSELSSKYFFFLKGKGYEADQLIAFLTKKYYEKNKIIIFSGDKDLLQLTSYSNTFIADKFEKGCFLVKTNQEIFGKFKNSKGEDFTRASTNVRDILKYRSLKGDPSDNLSPVFPRIKDKEIIEVIKNYWTDDQKEELTESRIEEILESMRECNATLASKLQESKGTWLRNYKIMDLLHVDDISIRRLR